MMSKKARTSLTAFGVAFIACLLATLAVQYLSFMASLENVARDIRVAALSALKRLLLSQDRKRVSDLPAARGEVAGAHVLGDATHMRDA